MTKTITSLQNKTIKERAKLYSKKERNRQSLFIIEGKHLIEEAIKAGCLKEYYLLEGTFNPFKNVQPIYCSKNVINKLSNQKSQSTMIGICTKPILKPQKIQTALFLDAVQDPGNVGTLIRSAFSFHIDAIYLSLDCADIYNFKTIQSSQGAVFHIFCQYTDLKNQIIKAKKADMKIYGTALHAHTKPLQQVDPPLSYGILLGNEGNGLNQEMISICDETIYIEMDAFESLNVAVAGSILMYTLHQK